MTRHISLIVNDSPIEMDYFVQGFVDHTVYGMVSSLEGIEEIHDIEIKIDGGDTKISINGNPVPLNDFVSTLVSSTTRGMVSTLKGVEKTGRIRVAIER
jgi:hypothetical protein